MELLNAYLPLTERPHISNTEIRHNIMKFES